MKNSPFRFVTGLELWSLEFEYYLGFGICYLVLVPIKLHDINLVKYCNKYFIINL